MASPIYQTAGTVINRAAIQLGLSSTPDPYSASNDPSYAQLCEFLGVVGEDLLAAGEWPHLRREYSFAVVNGQSLYALPSDFHEMIDQSGWNRSTRLPLGGPMSSQQWQYLKARQIGVTLNVLFRITSQEIEIFPSGTAAAGTVIAFEYVSTFWVQDAGKSTVVDSAGAPVGDKDAPTQFGDLILFDPLLVISALKVRFLQAKGLDTSMAQADYDRRLDHYIAQTSGSPVLSLHRRSVTGDRLLDGGNMPITNFGGQF